MTVVVPTGKKEPDGGEQVMVPQVPELVGADRLQQHRTGLDRYSR